MATEPKLFEDAFQSVTQPFEQAQSATESTSSDLGDQPGAANSPPSGGSVETPGATPPSSGEAPQGEQGEYNLEEFNKFFKSEFKDVSSLKEAIGSSSKLSEYEKRLQEQEAAYKSALEKSSKYDELIDNLDPKKLYGDTEMYTYFKLKEKFPDHDPALLAQIRGSRFDSLTDIEKLVLADKLKVRSNISDSVRQKAILQRLNIEADDLSELDDTDRYKLASAVADKEVELNEIRKFAPEPLNFDFTSLKESRQKEIEEREAKRKNSWEPLVKSLMKNYEKAKAFVRNDKGDFEESFSFAVDDKFKEEFFEPFLKSAIDSGMEVNQENLQIAANYLDERFKVLNFDRIVNEAIKHGRTLSEDKAHSEIHNDKPQNTSAAPETSSEGKFMTLKERIKQRIAEKR